jgi:hypothetical protein
MRLYYVPILVCLCLLHGCRKPVPDSDLDASRLRSRILAHASSPAIPHWVLPSVPCVQSNEFILTKVFINGQNSLAEAQALAKAETGLQSSENIYRCIVRESGITNVRIPAAWCSQEAKIIAYYWEAWRPEETRTPGYSIYLQAAFPRALLQAELDRATRKVYGTNSLPAALTNLFFGQKSS